VFDCPAANGISVSAAVYAVDVEGPIRLPARLPESCWIDPHALPDLPFAPLLRDRRWRIARERLHRRANQLMGSPLFCK
jgi:hypothetical protein